MGSRARFAVPSTACTSAKDVREVMFLVLFVYGYVCVRLTAGLLQK